MYMLKWILRFFYLMIITVATVYVYGSANYSRLEAYYKDHMADVINQPEAYLKGINTIMGLDYYASEPAYLFEQNEGNYQFKLALYPIGVSLNDVLYDGLMVYVYDVKIIENGEEILYPKIKITVDLDRETFKNGDEFFSSTFITFDPEKEFPYSYVPNLFLLYSDNYLKVSGEDAYANITKLTIAYSDGALNDSNQLIFKETMLFIGSNVIVSDAAHIKTDQFIVNPNDFRLSLNFPDGKLSETVIADFGLVTDAGNLSDYNGLIWRTMTIYVLIAGALTYFLFFHKVVMEKIRARRMDQPSTTSKPVVQEAIFKDIEYKNEDGK